MKSLILSKTYAKIYAKIYEKNTKKVISMYNIE